MAKKIRTCVICGKQYEYCSHCPSKNYIEPWRTLYCSENCRDAFRLFGEYKSNVVNAENAREQLELWGLTPEKVRDNHKAFVEDIFDKGKKVIVEPIAEEVSFIPEVEIVEDKTEDGKKKKKHREEKIVNED